MTLGPKGRNAIIEQGFGPPKITKDGVTVAKAIEFADAYENMGAQLIKQVGGRDREVYGWLDVELEESTTIHEFLYLHAR